MDIFGKNALVLGGFGLVGNAVCRELLAYEPARLVVASLRKAEAEEAVKELERQFPKIKTKIIPAWGDVFLRAEWQEEGAHHPRPAVLADEKRRRRLVADVLDELDEEVLEASLLTQFIKGTAKGLDGAAADIVVDCINTATAVAYQNIYGAARHLTGLIEADSPDTKWGEEIEQLLASQYIPQLVRHIQILHEAMLHAGTQAYVKVGTSGTGGMGLNIPYTHGEEKPSRVLMSKAAVAGAQTLLLFLMARTPEGPHIVKEIKPTALIAWKGIGYGPIRRGGRDFVLYDCTPEQAVSIKDPANLVPQGDFGEEQGDALEAVYIDTGENGLFATGDFSVITALGQMEFVTPEEIAHNVVREILGGNTGKDVIGALDSSATGPTFRAGFLRQAALNRLHQLEAEHGESVAFEILGPPRMSKLLYEAYLLKLAYTKMEAVLKPSPEEVSATLEKLVNDQIEVRQRIISIGLPILLPDGEHMLRGPMVKSENAYNGWVDLTPGNMEKWQERLNKIREMIQASFGEDSSSAQDRGYPSMRTWQTDDRFDIGELVAWVAIHEDKGRRGKD